MDQADTKSETKTAANIKKSDPVEGRCQFFLERKKRYCRTIPPNESTYCVEHSHLLGDG